MNKLSAYTIAANCTDTTDLQSGIDEINEAIKLRTKQGQKIPSYYFCRLKKLEKKLSAKQRINTMLKITVTTRIAVDLVALEMAIRFCICHHTSLSKTNIIKTIKGLVAREGRIITEYPERWGKDLNNVNRTEVQKALQSLRQEFNL